MDTSDIETTIAHRFAAAANARDIEALVALFTVDASYRDLFYGEFTGPDGLRALFGRMFSENSWHRWTITGFNSTAARTFAEWTFEFTVSGTVPSGAGRTIGFPGVSVFDTRDGYCHAYREHFDRTATLFAVGIPPESVATIVRRRSGVSTRLPGSGTLAG